MLQPANSPASTSGMEKGKQRDEPMPAVHYSRSVLFNPYVLYKMPPTEKCETVPAASWPRVECGHFAAGTVSHISVGGILYTV